MAKQEVDLERLGAELARGFEQLAPERAHAIEQARFGFMGAFPVSGAPREWFLSARFAFGALLATGALAAALFVVFRTAVPPLTFKVDGQQGVVQSWLAAQGSSTVRLEFSDGSAFRLAQASRARVTHVAGDGAHVSLESGSLHADVVHTGSSHWELVSGPLVVRVTGTRFDLNWNPVSQLFSIHVTDGSVVVSGPLVGPERPVRGGETLLVSVPEQRLELTHNVAAASRASSPPSQGGSQEATPSASASAVTEELGNAPRMSRPSLDDAVTARKAWRELAARGALREAFAAAEAAGFNETCQSASASELLLLGDAARLAGRPERVGEALLSLRRRYPTDSRRAAAAFMLGKVAFDQRRAFAQAASWFSTCIREQPGGSLAREASGRLIEALRAAGDSVAAERAAREYLSRYPEGPHAPLARSLAR